MTSISHVPALQKVAHRGYGCIGVAGKYIAHLTRAAPRLALHSLGDEADQGYPSTARLHIGSIPSAPIGVVS